MKQNKVITFIKLALLCHPVTQKKIKITPKLLFTTQVPKFASTLPKVRTQEPTTY